MARHLLGQPSKLRLKPAASITSGRWRRDADPSSVWAGWNRADNRRCPASAKTWSIYCAMQRASELAACGAHHRRPAMETVRAVIEERTAGRNYKHRLMDYNKDSTTSLADVHSAFAVALSRMPGGSDQPLPPPPVCPPAQPDPVTAADLAIVDRARDILGAPDKWNKADGQTCSADQKTLGIFCALKRASEGRLPAK